MFKFLRARRAIRHTVRELERLSDHELTDLGIHRYDIKRVARISVLGE